MKALSPDDPLPGEPFARALEDLAAASANPEAALRAMGVAAAERWASMVRGLVAELQGRPAQLVELFCEEVHPWLTAGTGSARVHASGPQLTIVTLEDGLAPAFRAGLLEGIVGLTGTSAVVRVRDATTFELSWAPVEPAKPAGWALLAQATRASLLPVTLGPLLVGTALAWWSAGARLVPALLALLGAGALHLSANTLNDVVDRRRDAANLTPTTFAGGSRVLQRGLLSTGAMAALATATGLLGVGVGLGLVLLGGLPVLLLGASGVALGLAYSTRPLRLADRGLGELTALVVFGPLVTAGAFAVQTGTLEPAALAVGVPLGLLVAAFLVVNAVPDAPWDARTGRRTLAVAAGEATPALLAAIEFAAFVGLGTLVVAGLLPLPALAGLAAAPLGALLVHRLQHAGTDPERLAPLQRLALAQVGLVALLVAGGLAVEVLV